MNEPTSNTNKSNKRSAAYRLGKAIGRLKKHPQVAARGILIAILGLLLWDITLSCGIDGCLMPREPGSSYCTLHQSMYPIKTNAESTQSSSGKSSRQDTRGSSAQETSSESQNALKRARAYLDSSCFSAKSLQEQLEYEGFSPTAAKYAVEQCGADWNKQAAGKAKQYMSVMSFSRSKLIEQLEYEGFTRSQSEYGATSVGY